ncbi:MAG: hypothetical protein Q4F79_06595 [Eubacteriales bacterium]|nr:hypothetical protein [Eubacteriales bacterium]
MSIQGIVLILLIFAGILGIPLLMVFRAPDEETSEKPEAVDRRRRATEEYAAIKDSATVQEMAALVRSVPYLTRATLRAGQFRLERKIDRIGELVKVEGEPQIVFDPALSEEQIELYRLALEEALQPDYLSSPIYVGKKKERRKEGYYIYLDPQITGKVVDDRTKEAIYNGERTSDI